MEFIIGDNNDNTLSGTTADEVYFGAGGNDTFINAGGQDIFIGGDGVDTLETSVTDLPPEDSVLLFDLEAGTHGRKDSEVGQDQLYQIENFVFIGDWDAELVGDSNDNALTSDAGDDIISGGGGDDILTSGNGADQFLYDLGDGHDTITDFDAANDVIVLGGAPAGFGLADLAGRVSQQGDDVLIDLGGGSILLQDTALGSLSADNIEFM